MDIEHFTAVTQTEPNYGSYPWFIAKFLDDAQRSVGRISKAPVRSDSTPEG
jgi:hypothetical protein